MPVILRRHEGPQLIVNSVAYQHSAENACDALKTSIFWITLTKLHGGARRGVPGCHMGNVADLFFSGLHCRPSGGRKWITGVDPVVSAFRVLSSSFSLFG